MNVKLLAKTVFLIIVLLFLVLMGMHNRGVVTFALPPVLPREIKSAAAIMYIAFFAFGLLTGTILTAGGGGKKSGSSSKPSRGEK